MVYVYGVLHVNQDLDQLAQTRNGTRASVVQYAFAFSYCTVLVRNLNFEPGKMEEQVELEEDFDENYEPSAQGTTRM